MGIDLKIFKNSKSKRFIGIFLTILFSIFVAILSKEMFINNDNYFPLSYLYMLGYDDFYQKISNLIPFNEYKLLTLVFTYIFITPLASTYAPLLYLLYPLFLIANEAVDILNLIYINTLVINFMILFLAYRNFLSEHEDLPLNSIFIIALLSIGNVLYFSSSMPYAFSVSIFLYICSISIRSKPQVEKEIIILTVLYLLNYQTLFLLPGYFLVRITQFNLDVFSLDFKKIISLFFLMIVIATSLLFFYLRADFTGTHSSIGINWSTGENDIFLFDLNNFGDEIYSFLEIFPLALLYHIHPSLYDFKFLSVIFWASYLYLFYCFFYQFLTKDLPEKNRKIFLFLFGILTSYIFLAIIGSLVFGPTRHTLFLMPSILLLLFMFLKSFLKRVPFYFLSGILVLMLANSTINFSASRQNNFFEDLNQVAKIIETRDYDIVLPECSYQPFINKRFRNLLADRNVYFWCGQQLHTIKNRKNNFTNNQLIFTYVGTKDNKLINDLKNKVSDDFVKDNKILRKIYSEVYDFNIEQKELTKKLPTKTGLYLYAYVEEE